MPAGKAYSGEFKQKVIEDMRKNKLSYRETARRYGMPDHHPISDGSEFTLRKGRKACTLIDADEQAQPAVREKDDRLNWINRQKKT